MKQLFLFLIAIASHSVFAQGDKKLSGKIHLSLGAEVSIPNGLFGEVYSYGIGVSGQANLPIARNTAFTIYGGYNNYFLKKSYGGGNQGFIPVLGGVEVSISPVIFTSLQSGVTFYTQNLGSAFCYSPGVGIRLSKKFTTLFKYIGNVKNAINSGAVGVRAAYIFGK